jgi:hypothetical protein
MNIGYHEMYPLFLSDFNKTSVLSTGFLGAEFFHATKVHRRTNMTKVTITFRHFENARKN